MAGRSDTGIVSQFYGDANRDRFAVVKSTIVFSPRKLYFAARRGRQAALIKKIDDQLWELKRDKRSAYYLALARWFSPLREHHLPPWVWWVSIGIGVVTLALVRHIVVMRQYPAQDPRAFG